MKLQITGQSIRITQQERLVSGTANVYTAEFAFDRAWDEYTPVAIFEAGPIQRKMALKENRCLIPWETLLPGGCLRISVYGVAEGGRRLPTVYTDWLYVERGGEDAPEAAEPTPGVVDQVLVQVAADRKAAEAAAQKAQDAAGQPPKESCGGSGGYYTPAVTQPDKNTMRVEFTPSDDSMPAAPGVDLTLPDGPDGKAATIEIAGTETLEANQPAAVEETEGSTAQARKYIFKVPQGKQGNVGATPNLQIGAVETLPAGSPATASVSGTAENPLLNLGIPKGADGKTAYQYAVEGGYTGTEEEFAAKMAKEIPTEPKYELISDIEITEDGVSNLSVANLSLDKMAIYIYSPANATAFSWNFEFYKASGLVGYVFLGNLTNTGARWANLFAKNENGIGTIESTSVGSSAINQGIAMYRCPMYIDGTTPFTKFAIYLSSGSAFPVGAKIQIWGIKSNG